MRYTDDRVLFYNPKERGYPRRSRDYTTAPPWGARYR